MPDSIVPKHHNVYPLNELSLLLLGIACVWRTVQNSVWAK
jgi:hypothetical protein